MQYYKSSTGCIDYNASAVLINTYVIFWQSTFYFDPDMR